MVKIGESKSLSDKLSVLGYSDGMAVQYSENGNGVHLITAEIRKLKTEIDEYLASI